MEVMGVSLNALVQLPLSLRRSTLRRTHDEDFLLKQQHSLFSNTTPTPLKKLQRKHVLLLVVQAKGKKKGMQARQSKRPPPPSPPSPKIKDDDNPEFVVFIRMVNDYLWYPLSVITGGPTAKIMVAGKDGFIGKYLYKDTMGRNLAAVVYRDEKELQKTAFKQHRVLRSCSDFRYGYKLVENGNMESALSSSDVIELPTREELKTVIDKVKDFFGGAKESFGKPTALNSTSEESNEEESKETSKLKRLKMARPKVGVHCPNDLRKASLAIFFCNSTVSLSVKQLHRVRFCS